MSTSNPTWPHEDRRSYETRWTSERFNSSNNIFQYVHAYLCRRKPFYISITVRVTMNCKCLQAAIWQLVNKRKFRIKDLSFDSSVQINVSRHHSTKCLIRPILDVTFAVFDQEVNKG